MTVKTTVPAECALPGTPLAAARKGVDACVHCGFCLQACPTYLTLEDENDSPRGRILLMRTLLEGALPLSDESVHTHIDRCLGCRACETVCPSGVPYGQLLEATRATFTLERPLPFIARVILWAFERRPLLALGMFAGRVMRATGLARLLSGLPGRAGFAMAMLASTKRMVSPGRYTAQGTKERGTVALLEGCVMEGLFAETNRATERVLAHNDYAIVPAAGQQCCGALHAHAGDAEGARRLARANVAAFERSGAELICANAAGCGAMMKEYGHLLHDDPAWAERAAAVGEKVRDVSELLAAAGPKPAGDLPLKVTYDAPCHLIHAQRITRPPLDVLRAIPGLDLVPLADSDQCCGAAGIYNLIEPETSNAVLARKLERVRDSNADLVVTGNPGCMMQIGAGLIREGAKARVVHPVDLLDAAYGKAESDSARSG